jgi:nickel transport protein
MRTLKPTVVAALLSGWVLFGGWPGLAGRALAEDPQGPPDCRAVMVMIEEQNTRLAGDLRRVQREIAALRADLDKPGVRDVFAGIGYIFGLFGTAAFVAARKKT